LQEDFDVFDIKTGLRNIIFTALDFLCRFCVKKVQNWSGFFAENSGWTVITLICKQNVNFVYLTYQT